MKYFDVINQEKIEEIFIILKRPIGIDENVEIQNELMKILSDENAIGKRKIIDFFIKNGDVKNRFFEIELKRNDISLKIKEFEQVKLKLIKEYIESYFINNMYLLFESALSTLEINRVICKY